MTQHHHHSLLPFRVSHIYKVWVCSSSSCAGGFCPSVEFRSQKPAEIICPIGLVSYNILVPAVLHTVNMAAHARNAPAGESGFYFIYEVGLFDSVSVEEISHDKLIRLTQ